MLWIVQSPIFQVLIEYANYPDLINLISAYQVENWLDHKQMINRCKAYWMLKKAMRYWSLLRIVTHSDSQVWLRACYRPKTTRLVRSNMSSLSKFNFLVRPKILPLTHFISPIIWKARLDKIPDGEYGNDYQFLRHGELVCSIHWHFYGLSDEDQPRTCKLRCGPDLVIDEQFTGVFTEPFPIIGLQTDYLWLDFPEYTWGHSVYGCIKYLSVTKDQDRRALAQNENYWTNNLGKLHQIKHIISTDGSQLGITQLTPIDEQDKVEYVPLYKQFILDTEY